MKGLMFCIASSTQFFFSSICTPMFTAEMHEFCSGIKKKNKCSVQSTIVFSLVRSSYPYHVSVRRVKCIYAFCARSQLPIQRKEKSVFFHQPVTVPYVGILQCYYANILVRSSSSCTLALQYNTYISIPRGSSILFIGTSRVYYHSNTFSQIIKVELHWSFTNKFQQTISPKHCFLSR